MAKEKMKNKNKYPRVIWEKVIDPLPYKMRVVQANSATVCYEKSSKDSMGKEIWLDLEDEYEYEQLIRAILKIKYEDDDDGE